MFVLPLSSIIPLCALQRDCFDRIIWIFIGGIFGQCGGGITEQWEKLAKSVKDAKMKGRNEPLLAIQIIARIAELGGK